MESPIIISADEITQSIDHDEVIERVEKAFVTHREGRITVPPPQYIKVDGGVHVIKSAYSADKMVIKTVNAFPDNPVKYGMPVIQGQLMLFDNRMGKPLATIFDNALLTHHRTAASGAIAAQYLSRKESKNVLVVGAGNQGRLGIEYLTRVRPIEQVRIATQTQTGRVIKNAAELIASLAEKFPDITFIPEADIEKGCRDADIIITATPSREPLIKSEWVQRGTHINAMGADMPGKQELDPTLLSMSVYIADNVEQCLKGGELQHHLIEGAPERIRRDFIDKTRSIVRAELAEIITGSKPGRWGMGEYDTTIFDSTGIGAQDLAMAEMVYEKRRS